MMGDNLFSLLPTDVGIGADPPLVQDLSWAGLVLSDGAAVGWVLEAEDKARGACGAAAVTDERGAACVAAVEGRRVGGRALMGF